MSAVVFILIIFVFMLLAAPFIVSCAAICYNLSHYSTMSDNATLPNWEMKLLHALIYYPFLSFIVFIMLQFFIPEHTTYMVNTYCIGHALTSILGAAGAWYLRRRNKKYTRHFITNLLTGCLYFAIFFAFVFSNKVIH